MLQLSGQRTSHTAEAYMSNEEAREANPLHHLPTPFRSHSAVLAVRSAWSLILALLLSTFGPTSIIPVSRVAGGQGL